MVTIPTDFEKLTTTQKGNVGEKIVKEFLESKGFVVYKPITNKAHLIDGLATNTKEEVVIAFDVKTKGRLNDYHASGINVSHYQRYRNLSKKHNMNVFIFFVDECLGKVYGEWLQNLCRPHVDSIDGCHYPRTICDGKIICFSLEKMRDIALLSAEEQEELKRLSSRKYKFEPLDLKREANL